MKPKVYAVEIKSAIGCKANALYRDKLKPSRHHADIALVGQALRRYALNKEFGIPYENMKFGKNEHGKPFLIGFESVYFNVSHSGNICVCAVYDNEVGVDIQLNNQNVNEALTQKYFTTREIELLSSAPPSEKERLYFDFWAKHESLVKYYGLGISALGSVSEAGRIFEFSHEFEGYSLSICY